MANQGKKSRSARSAGTDLKEFVTVAFAEDIDLAKQYKKMLDESEIPAAIKAPTDSSTYPGIAVMVPEDHLDEAHVLIESQGSNDSFYDLAFQEDEDVNLDDDFGLDDGLYEDEV